MINDQQNRQLPLGKNILLFTSVVSQRSSTLINSLPAAMSLFAIMRKTLFCFWQR